MPSFTEDETASEFFCSFSKEKEVRRATVQASALGVYSLRVNGKKLSYVLAPGWTAYDSRVQYQTYDITDILTDENTVSITASAGWRMKYSCMDDRSVSAWSTPEINGDEYAVIASILIEYTDGTEKLIVTDESWTVSETKWRYCNIYNGDIYDETFNGQSYAVKVINHPKNILVPQQGEVISEHESLQPIEVIHTPNGETVLDFGQNLTGYLSFTLTVPSGKKVVIDHAEILDRNGNFYNENYRSAKARIVYIGDGNEHSWKPEFTFYGFRYIRLTEFPCELDPNAFTAIVVHSDMERTGYFECSDPKINQLYRNIIWGQKGNFLDVPTDCPQRDERLGWTGDAQVFARCACYNYDTRKFYRKWLTDMKLEQRPDGRIPHIIPRLDWVSSSCGWADACVIVPWQMYLIYGDKDILSTQYVTMRRWINYMYDAGDEYIDSKKHFGDWLSQDAEDPNSCGGGTSKKFLALAFRAYSTSLFIKISKILGVNESDLKDYEAKLQETKLRIRKDYFENGRLAIQTQTAHVLTLKFELCEEHMLGAHADRLAEMIRQNGDRLTTGFLGTPYILHVLEEYGYEDIAYTLLFQNKLPSWLYAVEHGATTIWEHWDGVREDGTFCGADMNSYNHYAYGAVGDWLYSSVAGIDTDEENPGFMRIRFKPKVTGKLTYAKASLKTPCGKIASEWHRDGSKVTYTFSVPSGLTATAEISGQMHELSAGTHTFVIE